MLNLLWHWSGRLCALCVIKVEACTTGHPGGTGIPLALARARTHTHGRFEALPACSSWRASICQERQMLECTITRTQEVLRTGTTNAQDPRLSLGSSWRCIFVDQPTSRCTSSLKKEIINWNYRHTPQVYPEYPSVWYCLCDTLSGTLMELGTSGAFFNVSATFQID